MYAADVITRLFNCFGVEGSEWIQRIFFGLHAVIQTISGTREVVRLTDVPAPTYVGESTFMEPPSRTNVVNSTFCDVQENAHSHEIARVSPLIFDPKSSKLKHSLNGDWVGVVLVVLVAFMYSWIVWRSENRKSSSTRSTPRAFVRKMSPASRR
jgi:hypothetical protein